MSEPPEQPAADPPPTLAWALLALALIAWGASLATREPTPQTAEAPVPADAMRRLRCVDASSSR